MKLPQENFLRDIWVFIENITDIRSRNYKEAATTAKHSK